MATLFKDVKYNLQGLINSIDMGTIGLPDIQRPFVWPDTKVRQLFDSLYKGYPVGFLLFCENANINGIKSIGTAQKQKAAQLLRFLGMAIDKSNILSVPKICFSFVINGKCKKWYRK